MKYPRMTHKQKEDNGSVKLTMEQIKFIRLLRFCRINYKTLAEIFCVNRTTIMYWCLPKLRLKIIKRNSKQAADRWKIMSTEMKNCILKKFEIEKLDVKR